MIIRKCRVLPQVTFSKFYNLYSLLSWQHDLHVSSSYYFLFSINLWSGITKSKVCHWCGYQIQQIWYHISFTIDATFTSSWIQQINSPIHVSFIFYEWISHGLCKPCNLDKFVNARAVQGVVLEVFQPCNTRKTHPAGITTKSAHAHELHSTHCKFGL